ncbi:hypothetical protein HK098_001539 [Nowakowskiella sp. JEL0407]|nr:hypothetical protein HK098_001539 [Nowakowskiella sp. JEL0407]
MESTSESGPAKRRKRLTRCSNCGDTSHYITSCKTASPSRKSSRTVIKKQFFMDYVAPRARAKSSVISKNSKQSKTAKSNTNYPQSLSSQTLNSNISQDLPVQDVESPQSESAVTSSAQAPIPKKQQLGSNVSPNTTCKLYTNEEKDLVFKVYHRLKHFKTLPENVQKDFLSKAPRDMACDLLGLSVDTLSKIIKEGTENDGKFISEIKTKRGKYPRK